MDLSEHLSYDYDDDTSGSGMRSWAFQWSSYSPTNPALNVSTDGVNPRVHVPTWGRDFSLAVFDQYGLMDVDYVHVSCLP